MDAGGGGGGGGGAGPDRRRWDKPSASGYAPATANRSRTARVAIYRCQAREAVDLPLGEARQRSIQLYRLSIAGMLSELAHSQAPGVAFNRGVYWIFTEYIQSAPADPGSLWHPPLREIWMTHLSD